jgi:competence protein ComEC
MTPISSIVIIGGMIMLMLFFIPYINIVVAWCVSKMIYVMNFAVSWIESLPYSIVKGLYINKIQFIILLLMLLAILLFVELKNKKMLFFIMIMFCCFLMVNLGNLQRQRTQKDMVIYSINNMTAIDFIEGRSHVLVADSTFFKDESAFSYNIENFLVSRGVFYGGKMELLSEDFDWNFVKKQKSVVTFGESLIGLSDGSSFFKESLTYRIPVDCMLVYGRKRQSLKSLLNVYVFDYLIIDASVPNYIASKLIEEAESLDIKYHNIKEDGAYFLK